MYARSTSVVMLILGFFLSFSLFSPLSWAVFYFSLVHFPPMNQSRIYNRAFHHSDIRHYACLLKGRHYACLLKGEVLALLNSLLNICRFDNAHVQGFGSMDE